jgi:hypothetical protein
MRNLLIAFSVSLFVLACEPAVFDVPSDGSADAADTSDATDAKDAAPASEVASTSVDAAQVVVCVDKDNDKYCDQASTPDCNDNDPNIFPGAPEKCGDNVDNNCNGQKDEGCTAPATSAVSVKVIYSNSGSRVLNVQVWSNKNQLGVWWEKSESSSGTTLIADLATVESTACGVRFNVSEGNPASSWLCEGNGSTANLKPGPTVEIKWDGKTYTKSDLKTWSAPGGTNAGCSALLQVKNTGDCAL